MMRRGARYSQFLYQLPFAFTFLLFCSGVEAASTHPVVSHLQKIAVEKSLATSPVWLKLGHYKKGLGGQFSSEAGGDLFFTSATGSSNPEAELLATIESFYSNVPNDEEGGRLHPLCRFPARLHWLEKTLPLDSSTLPKINCKSYHDYVKRLSADSISVVFSSYYMSSTASVFGHTFLRIHKAGIKGGNLDDRNELLNYGINFGAEATTNNPLLYAAFGVLGLFRGTFSNVPYYYKVREYNDFEARDLWSYELNFTQDQVNVAVDHLWEMGSTWFPYYFFTKNCSYQLLAALEPAAPDLNFTDALRYWVIPSDSVGSLSKHPGLVRRVEYRPSIATQFQRRLKDIPVSILQELVRSQKTSAVPETLAVEEKVKVLDAAMDFVDMKNPEIMTQEVPSAASHWKHQLLVARAKLGVQSENKPLEMPVNNRPDLGHPSARFGLGGGYDSVDQSFMRFQMRFALHDLLDQAVGYPQLAQIEFLNLKARYALDQGKFRVQEIGLINTTTIHPWTWYDHGLSSSLNIGAYEVRDRNCDHCVAGRIDGGVGVSFQIASWLYQYNFLEGEVAYSPSFNGSSGRFGAGPRIGAFLPISNHLRAQFEGRARALIFATDLWNYQADGKVRWSLSKNLAVEISNSFYADSTVESGANLYFYF